MVSQIELNLAGQAIKERRLSAGVGLREVRAVCGVSLPTLSRIETGKFRGDLRKLETVLLAINTLAVAKASYFAQVAELNRAMDEGSRA